MAESPQEISAQFCAVGISFQQADIATRERFSLSADKLEELLSSAAALELQGVLPLSTCNRTEIYAWGSGPEVLSRLLCSFSEGSEAEWQEKGWAKSGNEAMLHLLRVGSGLESKILGDFQIIGQIKKAFQLSKEQGVSHPYLERILNVAIRTSKRVKSETSLSRGSASVAFAAASYIRKWLPAQQQADILLIGTGDIGKATSSNLLKHFSPKNITVTNRSPEKGQEVAAKYDLNWAPWQDLKSQITQAKVVIVATGAPQAILLPEMVQLEEETLFLDLSVPRNIDAGVAEVAGATLLDMDELVAQTQQVLQERAEEVPKAEQIVLEEAHGFFSWMNGRKYAPIIRALKAELQELHEQELTGFQRKNPDADPQQLEAISKLLIHKTTGQLAKFLHHHLDDIDPELKLMRKILEE
ncbi:MAG: glutamyl-tRNA reductase [Bacteroidota bacterium]